MSRAPTIAEALAGAVLFGDLSAELAREALLSGLPPDRPCFPATVAGAEAAQRAGPGALLLSSPLIPRKVGAFWAPQPYAASEAIRLAEKHKKGAAHAFRWGAGVRGNLTVGALTCIAIEADSTSLQEQAAMLDYLDAEHGIRAGLVVMSGDTRPDSPRPLGLREGAVVEPGKSLHVFLPIYAVDTSNADHRRCLEAFCVAMRADLAATDHARLMRAPGVVADAWGPCDPRSIRTGEAVRVQTVLRAEASPVDVAELADKLEAACEALGLDIAAGLEALRCAAALRKAVGRCDAETQAALLQAAAETEAAAEITPEAAELLRKVGAMPSGKRGGVSLGGGYGSATCDRDAIVRAVMPGGEVRALPFAQWGPVLAGLAPSLGEHGDKGAAGLLAWAPTDAGERHTSGDKVGEPRATPAGQIWNTPEGVRLACFVESVVYAPSNPRDPATVCPPLPAPGASPYLSLTLEPGTVTVLRSDTGTGKTHGLIDALKAIPGGVSTAVVTPRVSITKEGARRYAVTDYQDQEGPLRVGATPGARTASAAVCINSVLRCAYTGAGPLWLVLEESDQIVASLFEGTIKLQSKPGRPGADKIVGGLRDLAHTALSSGGGVIAADAFAGDCTAALLRMILPPDTPIQERGIARRRPLKVTFWHGTTDDNGVAASSPVEEALDAARDEIAAGKRFIIPAFNAKDALAITELQRSAPRAARVKVFVAKDKPVLKQVERAPLAELSDVNTHWGPECADVVVYSPCVSAAVSYDRKGEGERFNIAILCAPHVKHGGWDLGVQMLDRARHVDEVWIACPARKEPAATRSLAEIKAAMQRDWRADVTAYARERGWGDVEIPATDSALADLAATVEYVRQLRRADPHAELRRYFTARGANIVDGGGRGGEAVKAALKAAKQRRTVTEAKMVCAAEPIERSKDAERLAEDTKHMTEGAEKDAILAQLAAFKLCERYGREHLTPELVIADAHGARWRKTKALVRAGLVADGETLLAIGERRAEAIAGGRKTGAKAEATKTHAMLILLRRCMGDEWLAALLEPVRGEAKTGASAMLKVPLPRDDGDGAALAKTWSKDAWDGEGLARDYTADLKAAGIDLALLRGSGYGVGSVREHHTTAIRNVLTLLGMKTTWERGATGDRRRVYRLDRGRWHERCELARKYNAVKRGVIKTPAETEPFAGHMGVSVLNRSRHVDGFATATAPPSPALPPLPRLTLFPSRRPPP